MTRPLCVDLFSGLGGWAEGFLAEGYEVVGFDIERHRYPAAPRFAFDPETGESIIVDAPDQQYPGQLVLQDVHTIHGSQFKDAACLVCSPPCQEFSYLAMPWSRGKQIAASLRGKGEFPEGYRGSRTIAEMTALFDACFRIQREASAAAGHHIPMVVENVRGAQPWVGRAPWNYGSFYLWGDVPALMPFTFKAQKFNPDGTAHGQGSWFAVADSKERGARKVDALTESYNGHDDPRRGRKTTNGSWFAIGANGKSNLAPDGRKVPMNFHEHEKTGKPGRSFQSAAVDSVKASGDWFGRGENCSPMRMREEDYRKWTGDDGTKQAGISGARSNGRGSQWFQDGAASVGSRSHARKAASAQIAKIPFELAAHIARCFKPEAKEQVA